jgi:hypothetical protein
LDAAGEPGADRTARISSNVAKLTASTTAKCPTHIEPARRTIRYTERPHAKLQVRIDYRRLRYLAISVDLY